MYDPNKFLEVVLSGMDSNQWRVDKKRFTGFTLLESVCNGSDVEVRFELLPEEETIHICYLAYVEIPLNMSSRDLLAQLCLNLKVNGAIFDLMSQSSFRIAWSMRHSELFQEKNAQVLYEELTKGLVSTQELVRSCIDVLNSHSLLSGYEAARRQQGLVQFIEATNQSTRLQ